ncbi:MAG: malate dehydrogenase, partial [Chitinophagaceae bacterium]|nr:malate dehydrogenase [Chitinophagaceae bacterium]
MALEASANDIEGMVIGGHGDTTMIPLTRLASYKGVPVSQLANAETLDKVKADTMVGGATLTGMLGTSAWYAPGAAVAALVSSIINDQKKLFPCCVYLDGEYGQKDICLGVPVVIGKNGWEKIVDVNLNDEEKAAFAKSAEAVTNMNNVLSTITA